MVERDRLTYLHGILQSRLGQEEERYWHDRRYGLLPHKDELGGRCIHSKPGTDQRPELFAEKGITQVEARPATPEPTTAIFMFYQVELGTEC